MTAKEKLKKFWNDNPVECIVLGVFAANAAAKVIDALSAAEGRRAYARQIDHKIKANRR